MRCDLGAVGEVEVRDRIERAPVANRREVPGAQGHERGLDRFVGVPCGVRRAGRARARARPGAAPAPCSRRSPVEQRLREPRAVARDRRERHEVLELRQVAAQLLDHLLDQRGAEVHAGEPGLAVRDRIEDRGVGVIRVERRVRARRAAGRARTACRSSARSPRTRVVRRASRDGRRRSTGGRSRAGSSGRPTSRSCAPLRTRSASRAARPARPT